MKVTKVGELKAKIHKLNQRIIKLQQVCKHPKRSQIIIYKGNTGGYDRDTYWTEHTCRLCGKFWREDAE